MAGDALLRRFRLERRISKRSAATRAVLWAVGFGAPAALLLVLHSRLTDPAPIAALQRLGLAWSVIVILALGGCAAAFLVRGPKDAVLARELDRRHRQAGLFSAAVFVLDPPGPPPTLGTLVVARADEAVASMPVMARVRGLRLKVKRTALFILLSLLIALVPGGPRGRLSGIGGGGEGSSSPDSGAESRDAPPVAPESRNDARTPLDELVTLVLKSDHQIYGLGAEITLGIELRTKRAIDADVPIEVMLAVTDGLPSPDVGLGPGFRPVPLRLNWTVPKEQGAVLKQLFPMKATLKDLGIYRPGLFTMEALAAPADEGGAVSEGVKSNEITFQVAENKEDLSTKSPQSQGQGKQPEKPAPDQKTDDKSTSRPSKNKPKLGDPDRLPDAQRVASLVQPIINPGPTIDKEVSVFEREPGGPAPPLPVPRKPMDDTPARTFLRRPEAPQNPPALSTEERDVVRRYFDSLRARKNL